MWPCSPSNNTNSLSTAIVCRFHLAFQERNQQRPQRSVSSHSFTITTFHDAVERLHSAVVEEFGDFDFNQSLLTKDETVDHQNPTQLIADTKIEPHESPLAPGEMCRDPAAVGSGKPQHLSWADHWKLYRIWNIRGLMARVFQVGDYNTLSRLIHIDLAKAHSGIRICNLR